jgi:AraC-like DNA-binding protein
MAKRKNDIHLDLIKNTLKSIERKLRDAPGLLMDDQAALSHAEVMETGDMGLITFDTGIDTSLHLDVRIHPQLVLLAFVLEGAVSIRFERIPDPVRVKKGESIFFSHPYSEIKAGIDVKGKSKVVSIVTSIESMHRFFDSTLDMNTISREELKRYYDPQKLYMIKALNGKMNIPLRQLLHLEMDSHFKKMYLQAKILEILALYFSYAATDSNTELNCPFLDNPEDIKRIRKAKQLLLAHVSEPLTIAQLSKLAGLNEFKLKNGFKDLYGAPIHAYLNEYRMQEAIRMLEKCNYTVNEIAYMLGYNKASNFIAAFKKKFGMTPKKYELELVR